MNPIEICVLILTMVFILVAIYLVSFLLTCRTTLKQAKDFLEKAENTLQIVNKSLPNIADDASEIVSNVNGITGKIDRGIGLGVSVLEKSPLSALYTAVGLGRSLKKKFSNKDKKK